jgi:hypothetical protein
VGAYIGGYWGARKESARECASRLVRFLNALGRLDPPISLWSVASGSAKPRPISIETSPLEELLERGRPKRDTDGEAISDLGFMLSLWNAEGWRVALDVSCGASDGRTINRCVLELPASAMAGAPALDQHARLIATVVRIWDVSWATWTTDEWRRLQNTPRIGPVSGWINYLGSEYAFTRLPSDSQRIEVEGVPLIVLPWMGASEPAGLLDLITSPKPK